MPKACSPRERRAKAARTAASEVASAKGAPVAASAVGAKVPCGFAQLPPEVLVRICGQLNPSSICTLQCVCRALARVARSDAVWREQCARKHILLADDTDDAQATALDWKLVFSCFACVFLAVCLLP